MALSGGAAQLEGMVDPTAYAFGGPDVDGDGMVDVDGDGMVDDAEFRAFLAANPTVRFGAKLVRVRGMMLYLKEQDGKAYSGINGDYARSQQVANGRSVYIKVNRPETAMWWTNVKGHISWCVGPEAHTGTDTMWAYVPSMGFGPEQAGTLAWTVYSYKSASWEEQRGVEILNLDAPEDIETLELETISCNSAKNMGELAVHVETPRSALSALEQKAEDAVREHMSSRPQTPRAPHTHALSLTTEASQPRAPPTVAFPIAPDIGKPVQRGCRVQLMGLVAQPVSFVNGRQGCITRLLPGQRVGVKLVSRGLHAHLFAWRAVSLLLLTLTSSAQKDEDKALAYDCNEIRMQ